MNHGDWNIISDVIALSWKKAMPNFVTKKSFSYKNFHRLVYMQLYNIYIINLKKISKIAALPWVASWGEKDVCTTLDQCLKKWRTSSRIYRRTWLNPLSSSYICFIGSPMFPYGCYELRDILNILRSGYKKLYIHSKMVYLVEVKLARSTP